MKKSFLIITAIIIGFGCCNIKSKSDKKIQKLNWLIGTWINVSGEKVLYEMWEKSNDSLFSGTSFLLIGNDTVFFEKIVIKQSVNDLFYIPTVSDQNEGKPVKFTLISDDDGVFIFENKEHDFPQRIVYSNPEADSLYAYIDGNENGKYHKSEFRFKRKNQIND